MSASQPVRLIPAKRYHSLPLLLMMLAGCASPGPPKPPSLHLPEIVSNLTAERLGEEVRLRWVNPAKTTDGLDLSGVLVAQLCRRVETAKPERPEVCAPVHRARALPGPSEMTDPLPAALVRGSGAVLEYRIELFNANERSAGLSSPAFAAAGSAPPQVAKLRVEPTAAGALVRWEPGDAADRVELDRVHLPSAVKPETKTVKQPGLTPSAKEQPEVHLSAPAEDPAASPFHPDPGGMIDATARRGERFVYTAQRVRHVVLQGHELELRGAMSAPVTVLMRDTFPPQSPTGVEAIAAKIAGALEIDLSWKPNTEDDLAGYLVYRFEVNSGALVGTCVTPSPLPAPAFHDPRVHPGHTYRYTVVAVDAAGNQSPPSAPTQTELPAP